MEATRMIRDFAGTLTEEDVLFVLITGGGSALLPLPCPGVTLNEKLAVIRGLVKSGATINELNAVRIRLSDIKGGKLALAASGAKQIISLIISDIVNDPIELIASGPTAAMHTDAAAVVQILKAHNLWSTLSDNIQQAIVSEARATTKAAAAAEVGFGNVENILIANNYLAVDGCLTEISRVNAVVKEEVGVEGVYLSNAVIGDVAQVAEGYFKLAKEIKEAMLNENRLDAQRVSECLTKLSIKGKNRLLADLNAALLAGGDVCLVAGGETTVTIVGKGEGGRNQQMVLEFMELCKRHALGGIYLLSAGTDGIDGPTDAAGAIGSLDVLEEQFNGEERKEIGKCIKENDSYKFFRSKPCHLVIGHTGTNVMDIQLLLICK